MIIEDLVYYVFGWGLALGIMGAIITMIMVSI
jgi:hypothetical protein